MKKIFSILSLLSLVMTLNACGEKKVNEQNETNIIHVYTRDSSSGTREAFEGAIGLGEGELTLEASEVSSNGDMATKVGADVSGIGYTSLTTDFETNNIKPLKFEGVSATTETVLDGTYKMQRPFSYVTRASGDFVSEEVEQLVNAFIDYITKSVEGLSVVEENGGIVDYSNAVPFEEIAKNYPILNEDNSDITIRTGGSTSVEKSIRAALESFKPLAGNVNFAMNQTGSSDGYKRTLGSEKDGANQVEIGFASREFKSSEDVSTALRSGAFCKDAVVVVVNENNSLDNLTANQVKSIYDGSVKDFNGIK